MKIFYSEAHKGHYPPFEVFDGGEKITNFEMPERAERILAALKDAGHTDIHAPEDFGLDPILAVHDKDYIDFLRTAFDEWMQTETSYPKSQLMPATFPSTGWRRKPSSLLGRAGYYMMDLSAPIVAGTYPAALQSAYCALSAAQSVAESGNIRLSDQPSPGGSESVEKSAYPHLRWGRCPFQSPLTTFALCRPPGHHAGRENCGGYCYINNAAVAANWMSARGRVAVLDIDYHAGNGTQDIFYERADVLTVSLHGDPDFEYPHYLGYTDEIGAGEGLGYHRNFPLPAGTDDPHYLAALDRALNLIRDFSPTYLVISAGMDVHGGDPLGTFKVTREGIGEIGKRIAALKYPSVIVMEGGYNNAALGENMVTLLEAFE